MCKGCLAKKDIEEYCKYVKNVHRWKTTGKSHEYMMGILKMGCPTGRKVCGLCGNRNGGKSSQKGKGKNKKKFRYSKDKFN